MEIIYTGIGRETERDSMSQKKKMHVPLHAPNIMNVCIDDSTEGEMTGRIYHCYDQYPWPFANVMRLMEVMEDFFDRISFPQASTQTRTFTNTGNYTKETLKKIVDARDVAKYRGIKGTFLICVKYRQNATWQGEVEWVEGESVQQFVSVLELLKILSNALDIDSV